MRWIVVAGGAAALVGLFFLVRPDDEDEPAPASITLLPTRPTSPGSSPSPSPSPTPTATPSPSPTGEDATEIEVEVEEGRVEGPSRVAVSQGMRIELTVESDAADEVHVHGYDLFADVGPGRPAVIRFRATVAGVFEVELEEAGTLLFQLEVTP